MFQDSPLRSSHGGRAQSARGASSGGWTCRCVGPRGTADRYRKVTCDGQGSGPRSLTWTFRPSSPRGRRKRPTPNAPLHSAIPNPKSIRPTPSSTPKNFGFWSLAMEVPVFLQPLMRANQTLMGCVGISFPLHRSTPKAASPNSESSTPNSRSTASSELGVPSQLAGLSGRAPSLDFPKWGGPPTNPGVIHNTRGRRTGVPIWRTRGTAVEAGPRQADSNSVVLRGQANE